MNLQIQELIKHLKNLPGVGEKTAQRLAFFLIHADPQIALNLASSIDKTVKTVCRCTQCNMITTKPICEICEDNQRHSEILCIVENTQDVYLIEKTNEFRGRYIVLGHLLSPIDGIGPDQLPLKNIEKYVQEHDVKEVILALNLSAEGESTIHYIGEILADYDVKITRLATGLPIGGDIEYTSPMTLSNAIKRRFVLD